MEGNLKTGGDPSEQARGGLSGPKAERSVVLIVRSRIAINYWLPPVSWAAVEIFAGGHSAAIGKYLPPVTRAADRSPKPPRFVE